MKQGVKDARNPSINAVLSQRFERLTSALWATLSHFAWNRTGKVLYVTAGFALPAERPNFGGIAKKFQRPLRVVSDFFKNLPESS
jgi:hypothetical protein